MFRRIRWQLGLWNASVFLAILALFGCVFLIDMRIRLYNTVDREMQAQVQPVIEAIQAGHKPPVLWFGSGGPGRPFGNTVPYERPLSLVLWNNKGTRISPSPAFMTGQVENDLRSLASKRSAGFVTSEGHQIRVLTLTLSVPSPVMTGTTASQGPEVQRDSQTAQLSQGKEASSPSEVLQVLRNTDDIAETLKQSLRVVTTGVILGALLAVFAGFLLASRALVPIRKAWDRQVEFVADASHELRTPLLAISANTELLLRDPSKPISDKAPVLSRILSETRRMNRLVTHLLTLARSDSHLVQLVKTTINLLEVIQDVIEQFRPLCEAKSIQLQVGSNSLFIGNSTGNPASNLALNPAGNLASWSGNTPRSEDNSLSLSNNLFISVDEERIRQLLFIMLDNALKYTEPGGKISIDVQRMGRRVEVNVRDSGCGIPREELPLIFNRFYRGDKSRSTGTRSTGLGLAIAKWIVEAHEGTIKVKSEEGHGSTFTVILPLK